MGTFRTEFSGQLGKVIIPLRNKHIGYNINVMRQSACLVFDPIMLYGFTPLLNCTPVDRSLDYKMSPT